MFDLPSPTLILYQHVFSLLSANCLFESIAHAFLVVTGVLLALGNVKRESVFLNGNQGSSNIPLYRTE